MFLHLLACAAADSAAPKDTGTADTAVDSPADSDSPADTVDTDTGSPPPEFLPLGEAGTILTGATGDEAGRRVLAADVNADGRDDLVVARMGGSAYKGGATVVTELPEGEVELADAGVAFDNTVEFDGAGRSIGAGDVSGDGVVDLYVGSPWVSDSGYVVFGPLNSPRSLDAAEVHLFGGDLFYCGHGGTIAELTGDTTAELIIGCYNDTTGNPGAGRVFIEFGPVEPGTRDMRDSADATYIGEETNDNAGRWTTGGGDVDGDGIGDLIVQAPWASRRGLSSGITYIVYGPPSGDVSLADADGSMLGDYGDQLGTDATFEDLDNDGLDDVLLGSFASTVVQGGGATFVLLGPAAGVKDTVDADAVILGTKPNQAAGEGIAAGDVDGDGVSDVVVGAPGMTGDGLVGLFYGPITGELEFRDAALTWAGEGGPGIGLAVGDFDGDLAVEIAVGAPNDATLGFNSGVLYVVQP